MKLLSFQRDGLEERNHSGFVYLVDKTGAILKQVGDSKNRHFYLRSCAKPLQAIPIINYGLDFSSKELAIACASHAGSDVHVKLLKNLLEKFDIDKNNLKCSSHLPLDKKTRHALIKEDKEPESLHNNCSGKHIGMLAVCKKNNWDMQSYLDFEHPLQKDIYKITQDLCDIEIKYKTLDGCGTPIYAAPLKNIGLVFLNIFLNDKYQKIRHAFLENPYLIGGNDRQDTQIMSLSNDLIAKVGAEGLIVVVNLKKEQAIIVKIDDANMQARFIVILEALKQLGWVPQNILKESGFFDIEIKTLSSKIVGVAKPLFNLK